MDDTPLVLSHQSVTFTLSGFIKKDLLKHQVEGIKWLWGLHLQKVGGILADDMGVGKTRQVCTFFLNCLLSALFVLLMLYLIDLQLISWFSSC